MTDEEQKKLCERLRRLDLERDVGVKAADEIERLNLELRHEHDVRAEAERGCVNMAKEIERLAALAQSDAEPIPQPQRNDGGEPCGECHLQPGETCDVCGAKAQSDAGPIARARYHLQAADQALHEVEDDPFADHAHTLVHEAAFMITDELELQALRKLPAQSDAEPVQAFAKAVLHGDDEHKAWLLEAAGAFIAGNPLPAPRGKGAAPPRPDASAGLIEAALTFEPYLADEGFGKERSLKWMVEHFYRTHLPEEKAKNVTERYLTAIRARAADRSEEMTLQDAALAQSDARLRCLVTGNPCGTDTWQVGSPCACANCQAWLAQSDADRPLGFRTNDVPNPYAEGPQSDARPLAWHWNSKLEGWTYTSDSGPVAWRYAYPLYPDEWNLTQDQLTAEERMRKESCVVEPLYAGPLTDRSGK
jgi:hypothetical protein